MNEQELKDLFAAMEAQGLQPMLCDTPVAVYETEVPCGTPVMSFDEYPSDWKMFPRALMSLQAGFMVPVRGESMVGAGINTGDLVAVTCGVSVNDGDIVLASIDGEYTVKTYFEGDDGQRWLLPHNEAFEPILLTGQYSEYVVGRVTDIVKTAPHVSSRMCRRILNAAVQRASETQAPSAERVMTALLEVAPMVTTRRQWYAVYRALADRLVVKVEDYDGFIALVREAVPEHKNLPTVRELQRMAVGSFTKAVDLWSEDNAPVQGKRFKDYVTIAERTSELLG